MVNNQEKRQLAVAIELAEAARTLAHSTRHIPAPSDSYSLLGELTATMADLQQICLQLANWHAQVTDGLHYAGEDSRGDGVTGTVMATAELERAAEAVGTAVDALGRAHSANGVVRWFDSTGA